MYQSCSRHMAHTVDSSAAPVYQGCQVWEDGRGGGIIEHGDSRRLCNSRGGVPLPPHNSVRQEKVLAPPHHISVQGGKKALK